MAASTAPAVTPGCSATPSSAAAWATARATLDTRLAALRDRADELDRAVRTADAVPVHMAEVAFVASQTRHDIAWLEGFRAQLDDPAYPWPMDAAQPPPA